MSDLKAGLVVVAALVVAALIVVGGWQLGWWLKAQVVNRNAKIARTSYEVQQTYYEQVGKDIRQVAVDDSEIASPLYVASRPELQAQRVNDVNVACDHIGRLTTSGAGIDPTVTAFQAKECQVP